jgi:hypothetical protein
MPVQASAALLISSALAANVAANLRIHDIENMATLSSERIANLERENGKFR